MLAQRGSTLDGGDMAGMPAIRLLSPHGRGAICAILVFLLTGCSAGTTPASSPAALAPSTPTRITAVVSGNPPVLYSKLADPAIAGVSTIEALVNGGLSVLDHTGTSRARLAESLPSLENGLWTVAPDGSMETTWKIRAGAQWHDGVPFDAEDLVFTSRVARDPELPEFGDPTLRAIADVRNLDDRTVVVSWSRPNIYADQLFGTLAMPIPRHLLESAYTDSKATFTDHPYWSQGFVGTGPFRLKEWALGSHLVVEAFNGYALGRPKIDEIEVRVILDTNVQVSNVLSGQIDVSLGRNLSPEQAALLREQWRGGRVDVGRIGLALNVWPQLVNPNPPIVSNLRFRQALYVALDRRTMAETIEGGLAYVADGWLTPSVPEYAELAQSLVRYEYDPARARQEIQALGYSPGPDGTWRDSAGNPLSIEVVTLATQEINQRTLLIVADSWQRVGVGIEPNLVPAQRAADPAYRSSFPGFQVLRYPSDIMTNAGGFHSLAARLPENNFIIARGPGGGINWSRYANPDLDALIDRFYATVPRRERVQLAGQILHHVTDQLAVMPLFWDPSLNFVSNRVQGVPPIGDSVPWNVEEWQVVR
jgi:peptide/nickel transport system substrate-binding protein